MFKTLLCIIFAQVIFQYFFSWCPGLRLVWTSAKNVFKQKLRKNPYSLWMDLMFQKLLTCRCRICLSVFRFFTDIIYNKVWVCCQFVLYRVACWFITKFYETIFYIVFSCCFSLSWNSHIFDSFSWKKGDEIVIFSQNFFLYLF